MQEIAGRPTIHPFLFIVGKAAGFFAWLMPALSLAGKGSLHQTAGRAFDYLALIALILGAVLILISSFALGKSIRIGLPTGETVLRTKGIYRYSRNPMYVGVHLVTLAAMLYTLKWWIILPGLFSIYIYHLIVLGEELFLERRFGEAFRQYIQKTGRYFWKI
ncbi:MAG: methyltransferase [Bacteroidota bacterium]|jgi:protein-S-isoprenylcysteine O-methyltransferase Ste14|nr:isoprenylcysteine carboxylmethyltransferase family protein [Prolixibacteraceae bacterium]MDI9564008.1 methyltransferase [Bacteroidota bacterium]NLS99140.1 isoprenylcysteine carboxylmethyltransferase family protein [Bacteroidales bacterium]OQB82153.1 MAG: hypothetical protein BWX87_00025 [Bacteroidetes bacterium ADurb.Bin123]HNU77336.1 methyltransferase [Prolixibacteraceae bacterium]